MSVLRALALWLVLLVPVASQAQDLLPVPVLSARVIDQSGTLDDAQRSALEARLAAFEAAAGPQIVILLVPTTRPEDIAAFAYRVADAWKIGRREVGDGVLIVVAKDDRRIRIEVAKALEGAVPDLAARQIIQNTISPAFKAGDYAGGLGAGVDRLVARIQGEGLPEPRARGGDGGGVHLETLGMFFFVVVPIIGAVLTGLFGRKFGSLLTGGAAGAMGWWFTSSVLLALAAGVVAIVLVGIIGLGSVVRGLSRGRGGPVVWGGGGWGGGGGGFGGGGFSSGGGGDFGGGGASGSW